MTDQQLIEALRRLDGPAQPRGQFRDDLYSKLIATGAVRGRASSRLPGGMPSVLGRGAFRFAVVAVAFVVAVVAYGVWSNLPIVGPGISPTPTSPSPSPTATESPTLGSGHGGVIAYFVCKRDPESPLNCVDDSRLWLVNSDGTDAHELLPDEPGAQRPVGWLPDGSRLLFSQYATDGQRVQLAWTDASGSPAELIPGESLCPVERQNCYASIGQAALSPDGTRLAYAVFDGTVPSLSDGTIAILEFATDEVSTLESTRIAGRFLCCDGYYAPTWSADGTRLAFALPILASYTINVDGTDLRRLLPADMYGTAPRWSPDGLTILTMVCGTEPEIHLVDPDGGNVRTLPDTCSEPRWTRDGRIVFGRADAEQVSTWVMDDDGANARRVDEAIPALTAAGCMVCTLRDGDGKEISVGYWQPVLEDER